MKREVVQDFLNLPGIAGVALIDGRSRPYFYGIDQILNFQQKQALAQGIQQVIETTPTTFQCFEFQFNGHQVYIYKLDHGVILLVLANNELIYPAYTDIVARLTHELQEDITSAIANFRLAAGTVTLNNASDRGQSTESLPPNNIVASDLADYPEALQPSPPPPDPLLPPTNPPPTVAPFPQPGNTVADGAIAQPTTLKDILTALNRFSQQTTRYLGPTMVANYWKSSRPAIDWLSNFQVDRSGQISFSGASIVAGSPSVTDEQHRWLQDWVTAFIKRCSIVIRDFPSMIRKMELEPQQKILLLSDEFH
ncbi:MAG: hypothetical protein VKK04_05540 [Synechococcales bacterium]|nr:hypothetical protein [Synechococcales bacterium]